ncbi:MAG: phage terminase small subunit P27 family [Planctomycetales bacterium]|nr:phage terminase small subunit P27 family [Planctomycetales bacterium]
MKHPKAPEHLDQAAKDHWDSLIPLVYETGQWDPTTADALAAYCSAWSRWQAAEKAVAELGAIIKSPSGFPIQNPYLAVANRAQQNMQKWGKTLGLPIPCERLSYE